MCMKDKARDPKRAIIVALGSRRTCNGCDKRTVVHSRNITSAGIICDECQDISPEDAARIEARAAEQGSAQ